MVDRRMMMVNRECPFCKLTFIIMFQMNLISFVKMFSYLFLYKSLQGLAQVNRTWLLLTVGYAKFQGHRPSCSGEDF